MVFGKKKKIVKRIDAPAELPPEYSEDWSEEEDVGKEEEFADDYDESDMEEPPEDELPQMPRPSQRPRRPVPQARKARWSVRSVPIQSQTVIYDESKGKAFSLEQAVARILNVLEEE